MTYTPRQIADALDLAVLKPNATRNDVECACALAYKHKIKSVCVAPIYVPLAVNLFGNVSCVIGFPHGNSTPDAKYREAADALRDGAKELDVVTNYGRFLDGDSSPIIEELEVIVSVTHGRGAVVKAILETCYYTPKQIRQACDICVEHGVDFVKTSTGFGPKGAEYVPTLTMIDAVKDKCQVKASGGINNYARAQFYLDLGCTRLGSSKFLELLP